MNYHDADRLRGELDAAIAHHNALHEALVTRMAAKKGTARKGAGPRYNPGGVVTTGYNAEVHAARAEQRPPNPSRVHERADWPRLLHPLLRRLLGPRAFARWCLWRAERLHRPPWSSGPSGWG